MLGWLAGRFSDARDWTSHRVYWDWKLLKSFRDLLFPTEPIDSIIRELTQQDWFLSIHSRAVLLNFHEYVRPAKADLSKISDSMNLTDSSVLWFTMSGHSVQSKTLLVYFKSNWIEVYSLNDFSHLVHPFLGNVTERERCPQKLIWYCDSNLSVFSAIPSWCAGMITWFQGYRHRLINMSYFQWIEHSWKKGSYATLRDLIVT